MLKTFDDRFLGLRRGRKAFGAPEEGAGLMLDEVVWT